MKKSWIIAAVAAVLLPSCGNKATQAEQEVPEVSVTVTKNQTADVPFLFPAQLRGKQDITIIPQVSATLDEVLVQEGQHVEKGQRMFVLNQTAMQAVVERAQAAVRTAETEVETQRLEEESKKILFSKNIISEHEYKVQQNQLMIARAHLEEAKAALKNARNDLSHTVICAPHTGVVGSINYKQGSLVGPEIAKPLTIVSDNSVIYAYISIAESSYLALMSEYGSQDSIIKNMPEATLIIGDDTRYQHKGKVETMSGIVDQATGAISVRVAFPNGEGLLASGGSGQVEIAFTYDCIVIPRTATFDIQDKTFVYVVEAQDSLQIANSREVKVYRLNETEYIAYEGLNENENVITEGVRRITNGQEVTVCN